MKTQLRMGLLLLLAAGALGCATTHFSALSKRVGPYEQIYDGWGGRLEIDDDYRSWQLRYNALSREERILYCIDQLQNEEDHEQHLDLLPEGLYSNSPENSPRAELIKIGKEAIPYLIAALDRKEKTGITPSRHSLDHWLVQDAALDVIQRIACHDFSSAIYFAAQKNHFMATLSSNEMNVLWTTIKDWWEVNKGGDEVRWAETSLMTFQKEDWWHRWWAVRALYARIGAKSYPILIQAYERLPKGTGNYDRWDNVTSQKENILYTIQKDPSPELRGFLLRTLHDNPFLVRLKAAQCLWTIKDKTGLETILQETKEKILADAWGDEWMREHSYELVGFFSECGTPVSRQMIVECLDAKAGDLRKAAVEEVPNLKMEKAVRKLPELFDDPYVLAGGNHTFVGKKEVITPLYRICDAAAEVFNKVVPGSPPHIMKTEAEQAQSLEKIKQWWQMHQAELGWDQAQGILKLKK